MTNEIREKSFDCVKWTREVRDRHYEETKDMSFEEWRRWLDERLSANPLMVKMTGRMTRLIADAVTGKLDVRETAAALPEEPDDPDAEEGDCSGAAGRDDARG